MKYPRTYHLPYSPGSTSDDKMLESDGCFSGMNVVWTEKLDGECTVMTRDYIHARSEENYCKPWQTYMKSQWQMFKHDIPDDITICGENLYAIHSIEYSELLDYFFVFAMFKDDRIILKWDEIVVLAQLLNLETVPEINRDIYFKMPVPNKSTFGLTCEGYVVRNANEFSINSWHQNIAKYVRKGHVQTDEHWTKNWKKAPLMVNS